MTLRRSDTHLLVLGSVFTESAVFTHPAVSPAGNRWQLGLLRGLQLNGASVHTVGYLPEPAWPRGVLFPESSATKIPCDIDGELVRYVNLPLFRTVSLKSQLERAVRLRAVSARAVRSAAVLSYNARPFFAHAALALARDEQIPWIPIVADVPESEFGRRAHDATLKDAQGIIYLSWDSFVRSGHSRKLHLDGGIEEVRQPNCCDSELRPAILYTGSMGKFGGVEVLVRAFRQIDHSSAELWICGKGENPAVRLAAREDSRIRVFGMVSESRLIELSHSARAFVNPRPSSLAESRANFPSKLLEYLSYGKPVISSWTPGLHPAYRSVLVVTETETPACLASKICEVLQWTSNVREEYRKRCHLFIKERQWVKQAARLLGWLQGDGATSPIVHKGVEEVRDRHS